MATAEAIEQALKQAFQVRALCVHDDSAKHSGHAGSRPEGGTHFRIEITAPEFAGKSRVDSHRMVYEVLEREFSHGLHALQISAKAA